MDFSMAIVSPTGTAPFLLFFFFFFFISTTLCARPACLVGDSGRGTDGEKITDAVKQWALVCPPPPKMPGNENEPLKKGKFVARQDWKEKEKNVDDDIFLRQKTGEKNMGFSGWPAAAIAD